MGTRSRISYIDEKGKAHSIYCHWDGYISGVGATLVECYDTLEKVQELISNGDCSSINDGVESYRDRGEKDTDALVLEENELLSYNYVQEYNYLFKNGKWYVSQGNPRKFVRLTKKMIKADSI